MEQEKEWNMEKGVESYLDISQMRLFAEGNWEYEQEPRMILSLIHICRIF